MSPKISVVIAVYNGVETISRAIDSYVQQTYPNKELVVIDGQSTDGTVRLLESYRGAVDCFESSADTGIYHAWNKALGHCSGDWICFIGCDDRFVDEVVLADLVAVTEELSVDFVSAKVAYEAADGRITREYGEPWNWRSIKRSHSIAHPGMLYNKSCFENFGKFNEQYMIAGDYEFTLRMGPNIRAGYLDKVTVLMGDEGVSSKNISAVLREVRDIQSRAEEIGSLISWKNWLASTLIIFAKTYVSRSLRALAELR